MGATSRVDAQSALPLPRMVHLMLALDEPVKKKQEHKWSQMPLLQMLMEVLASDVQLQTQQILQTIGC